MYGNCVGEPNEEPAESPVTDSIPPPLQTSAAAPQTNNDAPQTTAASPQTTNTAPQIISGATETPAIHTTYCNLFHHTRIHRYTHRHIDW